MTSTTSLPKEDSPIGIIMPYGIVPGFIFLSVGMKRADMLKLLDTYKSSLPAVYKELSDWLREIDDFDELCEANAGLSFHDDIRNNSIVFLKSLATSGLIHELHHTVEGISNSLGFSQEKEFKAYLQEMLFLELTKKVDDVRNKFLRLSYEELIYLSNGLVISYGDARDGKRPDGIGVKRAVPVSVDSVDRPASKASKPASRPTAVK